jgi:general secretion pathway protein J
MIRDRRTIGTDAGFTLLEVLVTTTLLAMLSVVLLGGIEYGTKIWKKAQAAAMEDSHAHSVQADLAYSLEHIYPAFVATLQTGFVDFDGRADRISFLTPDRDIPGSLARVVIAADPDDPSQLIAASRLELAPDAQSSKRILLHGLKLVEFSYYGPADASTPAAWHSEWRNKPRLPLLIRMHVTLADSGVRPWPDLSVAPRVMADVNCVYDPLTKYCQGRR